MRLMLYLLFTVPLAYAADGSTVLASKAQPAIVQSLSTGVYRPATVILEGRRAKVHFNQGGQMVLALDSVSTPESEEIVGVDKDDNYWAVYVDTEAAPEQPSAAYESHRDLLTCSYFLE